MTRRPDPGSERGIALITTLLLLMLVSALLVGFTAIVVSDQKFRGMDRDRTKAFYGAQAGLEKLTADLGNLFSTNFAPTGVEINALAATPPALSGIAFTAADGSTGYKIDFPTDANGNPQAAVHNITSGPYEGLIGLLTPYTIDVTAKSASGGETHMQRTLQTVAIPVFQFGNFSDVDLSFFAGPNFTVGGRVHTNGNLFLSNGAGATLKFQDKITAVGEVVRQDLSNGVSIDVASAHTGTVLVPTAPGATRALQRTEGSVTGMPGSTLNDPTWTNLSLSTYNGYLRNGRTGAKPLNLPLLTAGGSNPDLVRRPASATEDTTNPTLYGERYFTKASVRILLSDTAADLLSLPGVTATAPILLDGDWRTTPPTGYGPVNANHPPIALSAGAASTTLTSSTSSGANNIDVASTTGFVNGTTIWLNGKAVQCSGSTATKFTGCLGTPAAFSGTVVSGYLTPGGTGTIGGYIKIELQDAGGAWHDVTMEVLQLGIASDNLSGADCGDPNPDAIIRVQRLRDNPGGPGACNYANSLNATDYWPQVLFDTREALVRDTSAGSNILLGGVMQYVMLDVRNLSRWLQGSIGSTGNSALSINGYAVYFSDRRNNRNAASQETGEYGWEDTVNPSSPTGSPNGVLDTGEDVNGNGVLDTYGATPNYNGVANSVAPGSSAPLTTAASPLTGLTQAQAQVNRQVIFRRALKLVNGGVGNIVAPGLTIVSENPVYLQGDWNASGGFATAHVATAVIADAVTLLSNAWNDVRSFTSPYAPSGRPGQTTSYRVAIIAGKGPSFPQPSGTATDFGTDGGAHNFLRTLEQNATINYMGSIATFFFNRQATGTYKCCTTVYTAPTRNFLFDTDFLDPTKLPPMTPVFRDVNTLGFSQIIKAGQ